MTVNELLSIIVETIDLTPNEILEAQSKRLGLQNYFDNQEYQTDIYIQGSFAYGTSIKPLKKDADGDFDLDLVCEIKNKFDNPGQLKNYVGDILKNSLYAKYLNPEGKRCWTLNYEKFHIDILPCVPDFIKQGTFIKITHKDMITNQYSYKSSNPRGLIKWFSQINDFHYKSMKNNKKSVLFEKNKTFFIESMKYKSWADVEDIFLSSPLQNAVKLLKRHRDQMYVNTDKEDYKPISIIITVLVALAMSNIDENHNPDILYIIYKFISESDSFIVHNSQGWLISNPVDIKENLADRWHENNAARATEFYRWRKSLRDFLDKLNQLNADNINIIGDYFGEEIANKVSTLINIKKEHKSNIIKNSAPKPWNKDV